MNTPNVNNIIDPGDIKRLQALGNFEVISSGVSDDELNDIGVRLFLDKTFREAVKSKADTVSVVDPSPTDPYKTQSQEYWTQPTQLRAQNLEDDPHTISDVFTDDGPKSLWKVISNDDIQLGRTESTRSWSGMENMYLNGWSGEGDIEDAQTKFLAGTLNIDDKLQGNPGNVAGWTVLAFFLVVFGVVLIFFCVSFGFKQCCFSDYDCPCC